ncbi:hypothetical protein Pcinc_044073 [Petrolisthes cinctipes]|uniref:Uncharacterized protein n=1 Tax=Petrolisthes cinctipes TaxID=88211 RepID=A0AAE1BHU4_PETCI|nr:hypothetical protein Pcinc_044073 [Petrolisthes cinctipes]
MNRTLVVLALVAGLATCTLGLSPEVLDEYPEVADGDPESRLFFVTTNTTQVTVGYATFVLGVTSVLVLGALIALAYFYATGDTNNRTDYTGYSGSGYSDSYARKTYVNTHFVRVCNHLKSGAFLTSRTSTTPTHSLPWPGSPP